MKIHVVIGLLVATSSLTSATLSAQCRFDFTLATQTTSQEIFRSQDAPLVDIDGDGNLDCAASLLRPSNNSFVVYYGDGMGEFDAQFYPTTRNSIAIEIADFNGDTFMDILSIESQTTLGTLAVLAPRRWNPWFHTTDPSRTSQLAAEGIRRRHQWRRQ